MSIILKTIRDRAFWADFGHFRNLGVEHPGYNASETFFQFLRIPTIVNIARN